MTTPMIKLQKCFCWFEATHWLLSSFERMTETAGGGDVCRDMSHCLFVGKSLGSWYACCLVTTKQYWTSAGWHVHHCNIGLSMAQSGYISVICIFAAPVPFLFLGVSAPANHQHNVDTMKTCWRSLFTSHYQVMDGEFPLWFTSDHPFHPFKRTQFFYLLHCAFSMVTCVALRLGQNFASPLKKWDNSVLYRSHCAAHFDGLPLASGSSPSLRCPPQPSAVWLQHVCERWTSAVTASLAAPQCGSVSDAQ